MSVISVFGSDHKVGTSQTALCIAERLAYYYPDEKILLIHCEEKLGDEFSPMIKESMENLRPYFSGLYDFQSIINKSVYSKNLYIIGGANNPASTGSFHPDDMKKFLEISDKYFKYIICDCSARIDHGLSLGAIIGSDYIYIVLNQRECSLKRYEWLSPVLSRVYKGKCLYILNKYKKDSPYTKEYFSKRLLLDIKDILLLKYSDNGLKAEMQERSLLSFREKSFIKDIDLIIKKVTNYSKSSDF